MTSAPSPKGVPRGLLLLVVLWHWRAVRRGWRWGAVNAAMNRGDYRSRHVRRVLNEIRAFRHEWHGQWTVKLSPAVAPDSGARR